MFKFSQDLTWSLHYLSVDVGLLLTFVNRERVRALYLTVLRVRSTTHLWQSRLVSVPGEIKQFLFQESNWWTTFLTLDCWPQRWVYCAVCRNTRESRKRLVQSKVVVQVSLVTWPEPGKLNCLSLACPADHGYQWVILFQKHTGYWPTQKNWSLWRKFTKVRGETIWWWGLGVGWESKDLLDLETFGAAMITEVVRVRVGEG